jgi:dTDP-glucose pyrophosphorylase
MIKDTKRLIINSKKTIEECLKLMTKNGVKCLVVVESGILKGTLSDGDIRKSFLDGKKLTHTINDIYNKNCKFFFVNDFSNNQIKNLIINKRLDIVPLVDKSKKIKEIITWHNFYLGYERRYKKISLPVVIMAGGSGSRLKPFTDVLPKALIPINDKTIIETIIEKFRKHSIKDFNISINNKKAKIIRPFLKDVLPKLNINYIEEKVRLGTAGALSLFKTSSKNFFVSNCDILVDIDLSDFHEFHAKNNYDITLVACKMAFQIPYGTINLNSKGNLENIIEKPRNEYFVNTGLYLLKREILKIVPKNKQFDFNDLITLCIRKNKKIGSYVIDDSKWHDVGEWDQYHNTIKNLENK